MISINGTPVRDFTSMEYSRSTSSPIHNVYGHFTFFEWEDSWDDDSLEDEDDDDEDDDELDEELDDARLSEQISAIDNKTMKIFILLKYIFSEPVADDN